MNWTINGTVFADAGLANVSRRRMNLATDRLTFEAVALAMDAAPLFAYNDAVTVLRDSAPFFSGRCGRVPINASSKAESQSYEILGPWDQLERLVYQQRWVNKVLVAGAPTNQWIYKSRIILGQAEDGTAQTVGQVISDVLTYAASCGVEIAAGTIDAGPLFLRDEILDLSCADVIRRVARWCPDAMGWVDYSQTPPQFNWRRRAAAVVTTLAATACNPITLTELGRSQVPAVVLKYEVVNQSCETTTIDKYPTTSTGLEIGAIVQTIRLAGARVMTQTQDLVVDGIPTMAPGDILMNWLKYKPTDVTDGQGGLKPRVANLVILSASRSLSSIDQAAMTGELKEGTIQPWMLGSEPGHVYNLQAADDIITVNVSYDVLDNAGLVSRSVLFQAIAIKITATSGNTQTYTRPSITTGDTIPTGLAQALYECVNARIYAGSVAIIEQEVTGSINPGNLLKITGGATAWSTMLAPVQSVAENLDTGTTTITVGPPNHLTPSEVIDLLRANRTRGTPLSASVRLSGSSSDAGAIVLGSMRPQEETSSSPAVYSAAAADRSEYCFGYGPAAGAIVPVTPGTMWVGIPAFQWPHDGGDNHITVADGEVIGWEWDGTYLTVKAGAVGDFIDDDTQGAEKLRGWFHKWSVVDGVARPVLIGHLGNLKFPGDYAVKAS